jgi:tetratricopeptide (TPR) repeat protein
LVLAHHNLGGTLLDKMDLRGAEYAFRKAIDLNPKNSQGHNYLGIVLMAKKDLRGAVDEFQKAISLDLSNDFAFNNLAWLLATGPEGVRDGKRAVELSTNACMLTNWKNAAWIDTLAAAYAESGNFEKAVEVITQVLTDPKFAKQVRGAHGRLDLYKRRQPYRDPALAVREVAPPPREKNDCPQWGGRPDPQPG